jgi:hypothetical protein
VPTKWKILAMASLVLWGGAIIAGRMLPHTARQLLTTSY